MQRIRITSLTVLTAGSLLLIGSQSAEAQASSAPQSAVENYLTNGVSGLSSEQMIDLYDLLQTTARQAGDSSTVFVSELIRHWLDRPGVQPGMEADALIKEYERLHGDASPEFETLVSSSLADLTTAAVAYNPPIYIPTGPVQRLPRAVISPRWSLLGPIEKDGISLISSSR